MKRSQASPFNAVADLTRVAFVIAIASLSATAGAQTNEAQAHYESGASASQRGEPERAAAEFEKAIALRPSVAQYHDRLGNAYSQMALSAGMFERVSLAKKAKAEWERAVQLDPDLISARQTLIEFHLMAPAMMGGSDGEAKRQAAEIRRRDAIAGYSAMARIHTAADRDDLARHEYDEMLKAHGQSPRARYLYGVYLMLTAKDYRKAAAAFESALKLDPAYMPAYFQLGHVAALAGESFPRGEEALKKYLGYRPKDDEPSTARAHYWLGGIYEKQHRVREARASYTASLAINATQKDVREALKRVS
jgi:tetratricopeptide (TPR) repeat protein